MARHHQVAVLKHERVVARDRLPSRSDMIGCDADVDVTERSGHELWDDGDVDDEASVRSHPLNQIDVGAVPLVVSGIIVMLRVIRPDVASPIVEVADSEDGATQVITYGLAREAVW
eukprot:7386283-Prymnesium_polylepis.1